MNEATNERAYTISGFLKNVAAYFLGDNPIIVIDEASMVDLSAMHRLIRKLPEHCQMVMVGDPHQLPPIGAGLILHCLVEIEQIPITELTEVKRQADDSPIPAFARSVRNPYN